MHARTGCCRKLWNTHICLGESSLNLPLAILYNTCGSGQPVTKLPTIFPECRSSSSAGRGRQQSADLVLLIEGCVYLRCRGHWTHQRKTQLLQQIWNPLLKGQCLLVSDTYFRSLAHSILNLKIELQSSIGTPSRHERRSERSLRRRKGPSYRPQKRERGE